MRKTRSRRWLLKAIGCPFTKIITHALQRVRAGGGAGGSNPGRVLLKTKWLNELRALRRAALSERRDGEHIRRIAG
jgi:hypothetical protein